MMYNTLICGLGLLSAVGISGVAGHGYPYDMWVDGK
jgi:hypothetical protein